MAVFGLSSCNCTYCTFDGKKNSSAIKGNKVIVTKEINLQNYTGIRFDVPGKLIYRQTSDSVPYFQIITDENIFSLLDIEITGTSLKISSKANLRPSKLIVYTNSANLNEIKIHNAGEVYLKGTVKSDRMTINITGKCDLSTDSLYCEETRVDISGFARVWLHGTSTKASYSLSGMGKIHAYDYLVRNAGCKLSGTGSFEINVTEKLTAKISGMGKIRYIGNPDVSRNINGMGSVKRI
jgi:hypothetical protein